MRHGLIAAVLVILCAAASASDLLACGDKYFVPTRDIRFNKPSFARQDVAVLVYASNMSELSRVMNKQGVEATLQKAGYPLTVVRTDPELTTALARRNWDLVVVDAAEVTRVDSSRKSGAAVLPVNSTLSGEQQKLARQQYPALVKAPKNAGAFLEMIDAAVERQRTAREKKTDR